MKKIVNNGSVELINYDEWFAISNQENFIENYSEIKDESGEYRSRSMRIEGAVLNFINKRLYHDKIIELRTDAEFLQAHFEFGGAVKFNPRNKCQNVCDIPPKHHQLIFYPSLDGTLIYPKTEKNVFSLEIEISMGLLNRLFYNALDGLGDFGNAILHKKAGMLSKEALYIGGKMEQIIFEMYQCAYAGSIKRLFIEAKVMELISLQVNQAQSEEMHADPHRKYQVDVDYVHYVEEIMINALPQMHSIEDLARIVGVNRTKLQDDFKRVKGLSIFSFLLEYRLDIAQKMILENPHLKLLAIANMTGFKYANHFSIAFKKKFGYYPSTLKLKR